MGQMNATGADQAAHSVDSVTPGESRPISSKKAKINDSKQANSA